MEAKASTCLFHTDNGGCGAHGKGSTGHAVSGTWRVLDPAIIRGAPGAMRGGQLIYWACASHATSYFHATPEPILSLVVCDT